MRVAAFAALSLASCASNAWRKDFGAFVDEIATRASAARGDNTSGYDNAFRNQPVQWTLTYTGIQPQEKGGPTLKFDLDPFGLHQVFFTGKLVMIGFEPAEGTEGAWQALTPGTSVTFTGLVERVSFVTFNDKPGAHATIKNVRAAAP